MEAINFIYNKTAEPKKYSKLKSLTSTKTKKNNHSNYLFGFNGKEKDDELKGEGNNLYFGARIYDPRIGKFLSVDPMLPTYPWNSCYAFAENDVIRCIDLEGLEKVTSNNASSQALRQSWFNSAMDNKKVKAYMNTNQRIIL